MKAVSNPTTVSAAATGMGERGDWVVVGTVVGTVVGGRVVIVAVVGTVVGAEVIGADTVNDLSPIYPAESLKYTS